MRALLSSVRRKIFGETRTIPLGVGAALVLAPCFPTASGGCSVALRSPRS